MTTLMAALENAKNPAIIFGNVHRRQKDIRVAARLAKHDYTKLSHDDLLDLSFIKGFEYTLTETNAVQTDEAWQANFKTAVQLHEARVALGIDDMTDRKHCGAGRFAAYTVMFGIGPRFSGNQDRYCAILDEETTATALAA